MSKRMDSKQRESLRALCKALSRAHAVRKEHEVHSQERCTKPWAKEAVAELIGTMHMRWARERKSLGLGGPGC